MATVEKQKSDVMLQYLRPKKKFPSVWCPGCGNGIVQGALIRAIDKLGLSPRQRRAGVRYRLFESLAGLS